MIKKPAGSKEEIVHFNNLKPFEERMKNFKRIQPRAATRNAQPKFMDTEQNQDFSEESSSGEEEEVADEEEQNEDQLQRERYPARQRQAPDFFGGLVGYWTKGNFTF